MPVFLKCQWCGTEFPVRPARAGIAKYCSGSCRGKARSREFTGENHHRWTGGEREKTCQKCGKAFSIRPKQPITTFKKQKFCSKPCADKGGLRYSGADNARYNPDADRTGRRDSRHDAWADAVISNDKATCRICGATNTELHAHHVRSWKEYPELRFEVSNGIALCAPCHWTIHAALAAKAVNSGKLLPGGAEDNPEPSLKRKLLEGVTTRGRAYRRWEGECAWCGKWLSKRASDVKGKAAIFCSRTCSGRWHYRHKNPFAHGSNAPTSAAPERDDIV